MFRNSYRHLLAFAFGFIAFATVGRAAAAKGPAQGDRPAETGSVPRQLSIFVTAIDKHHAPVLDLKKDDLRVFQEKSEIEVSSVENLSSVPVTLGILIDTSNSQRSPRSGIHEQNILEFVESCLATNGKAFVAAFSTRPQLLTDLTADRQTIGNAIRQALSGGQGGSAIYDAIYLASSNGPFGSGARKIMVVFSDFEDNSSLHGKDEAEGQALRSHILVFPVLLQDRFAPYGNGRERGANRAKEFAEITGGIALQGLGDDQLAELQRILPGQYLVTLTLPSDAKPRFHPIHLRSLSKGTNLSAPAGFYFP